jgi:hypothetical protein
MAYVGTPIDTRNTFQSLQGKRFNGDGSTTAFTLDVAPSSTLDIEVFVGNVRQDPNSAYTLSGTTLTFTGAPPSGTNNIYVVHQAKSVGTIDPPAVETVAKQFNGGVVFNEDSASVDFRVESNGDANCLIVDGSGDKVGIGEDVPEGKLHIFTGDASVGPNADADELVVEGSGNSGISILSGASSNGSILFGDSGDDNVGGIDYDHNGNVMTFVTAAQSNLRWNGYKLSTGGETSPDVHDGGITLNLAANSGPAISIKSSDVAHGITGQAETDTYTTIKRIDANGGVLFHGFTESYFGMQFESFVTNQDTNRATNGSSAIKFNARLKSGTSVGALAANNNILSIGNDNTQRFFFDTDGDFHADSSSTTFDAYDDAQLVRAYDLSHGRGVINSKFDKFVAYNHEKLADLELVGREKDGKPNHFVNVTGMQRLHNGAIWQQYEKHNQLLEAVYDLAKEAVGEEKANAILEKHEVKRLQ